MTTTSDKIIITMNAYPSKGIIDWYINNYYLDDFFEACAKDAKGTMIYNNESRRYEICFRKNEYFSKDIKKQAEIAADYLQDPDQDGTYLINGFIVRGIIRSINGIEFYEWKEYNIREHIIKKFELKSEYIDVL